MGGPLGTGGALPGQLEPDGFQIGLVREFRRHGRVAGAHGAGDGVAEWFLEIVEAAVPAVGGVEQPAFRGEKVGG